MRTSDIAVNTLYMHCRLPPQFALSTSKFSSGVTYNEGVINRVGIATPFKECLEMYIRPKSESKFQTALGFSAQNIINANLKSQKGLYKNENWCISDHYQISQYDVWPKIREVQQEIDIADFRGMSDIEIYDWIEKKFDEAFGENFQMAYRLQVSDPVWDPASETSGHNFVYIGSVFYDCVHKQFGDDSKGWARFPAVNRARLYGDMSDTEIMDAFRVKYPPTERMTLRDYRLMRSELWNVGIEVGGDYVADIATMLNWEGKMDRMDGYSIGKLGASLLDTPLDVSLLFGSLNDYIKLGRNESFESEYRDFYVKYLGAKLSQGGLLYSGFSVPSLKNDLYSR